MNTTATSATVNLEQVIGTVLDTLAVIGDPVAYGNARHDWADDLIDRLLWDVVYNTTFRCHAVCGGLVVRIYDRVTNERVARVAWNDDAELWTTLD
jgi:hypothetical protein